MLCSLVKKSGLYPLSRLLASVFFPQDYSWLSPTSSVQCRISVKCGPCTWLSKKASTANQNLICSASILFVYSLHQCFFPPIIILDSLQQALSNVGPLSNADFAHDSLKRLQRLIRIWSAPQVSSLYIPCISVFSPRIILDSLQKALSNVGPLSNADFAHDSQKRLQRWMALH